MFRAKSQRGGDVPTVPQGHVTPSSLEGWLASLLCVLVVLASTAVLKRSRDFSRSLTELEQLARRRPAGLARARGATRERAVELVIVVVLHALRADRLRLPVTEDAPMPHLAALGAEGLMFRTALAQASHPLISAKSLLTGQYPTTLMLEETGADLVALAHQRSPRRYLLDTFRRVHPRLAEGLRGRGFRTAAFTDGPWTAEAGLGHGFEVLDDAGGGLDAIVPRALAWAQRERPRPSFLLVHAGDLAGWPERAPAADGSGGADGPPAEPAAAARYDAAVRALDAALGRFLEALRARGLYEPALIVVTADHGESLDERDAPGHGGLFPEQLLVPLVLKFPQELELAPAVLDAPVELVDLLPTLFELGGVPVPPGLDGRSLLPSLVRGAGGREHLIAETALSEEPGGNASPAARALLKPGRWQVIHDLSRSEASFLALQDDPAGLLPLPVARGELDPLLDVLLQQGAPERRALLRSAEPEHFEPALQRELEQLGYGAAGFSGDGRPGSLR